MAEWIIEDVAPTGEIPAAGEPGGGIGDLRNPDFPRVVGSDERWTGSIEAHNTGDEPHTFRVTKNGTEKATFDLDSGGSRTISFSGTGPTSFRITLERKVEKGFWEKYKKEIIIGSMAAGAVGLGYVASR